MIRKLSLKVFITPGSSTERIPKYFGVSNSSTISGFTVYETSDTVYFSNTVVSTPQTPAPPSYTPENCFTFNAGNIIGYDKNLCGNDVNIPPTLLLLLVIKLSYQGGTHTFFKLFFYGGVFP